MQLQATTYSGKPVLLEVELTGKVDYAANTRTSKIIKMVEVRVIGQLSVKLWVEPIDLRDNEGEALDHQNFTMAVQNAILKRDRPTQVEL